jgi:uncharacterized protein YuzE
MIRTEYDPQADVMHIKFGPEGVRSDTSEEVAAGVYLEFDADGNPIAVEITSASKRDRVDAHPKAA